MSRFRLTLSLRSPRQRWLWAYGIPSPTLGNSCWHTSTRNAHIWCLTTYPKQRASQMRTISSKSKIIFTILLSVFVLNSTKLNLSNNFLIFQKICARFPMLINSILFHRPHPLCWPLTSIFLFFLLSEWKGTKFYYYTYPIYLERLLFTLNEHSKNYFQNLYGIFFLHLLRYFNFLWNMKLKNYDIFFKDFTSVIKTKCRKCIFRLCHFLLDLLRFSPHIQSYIPHQITLDSFVQI